MIWTIDNLKCAGCAKRITQKLQAMIGVNAVNVDVALGQVYFEAVDDLLPAIEKNLIALGYPRTGTTSGFSSLEADMRSVVSCAIGRMQTENNK
jgi:copper chaperone